MATAGTSERPLYEPIRRAIDEGEISRNELALATGVDRDAISRLVRGDRGTRLKNVDKVLAVLGYAVLGPDGSPRTVGEGLLSAIDEGGWSHLAMARASGVGPGTIRGLATRRSTPRLENAEKLFITLGLKLARVRDLEHREASPYRRDLETTLRTAIGNHAGNFSRLANRSGASYGSLRAFFKLGILGLELVSIDRLFAYFGLAVARVSGDGALGEPLPPSVAIRSAILEDTRTPWEISKSSCVLHSIIIRLIDGGGVRLEAADRLFDDLPLRVVKADPAAPPSRPGRTIRLPLEELRTAIRSSGYNYADLSRRSRVSGPTISKTMNGYDKINYETYFKLATAVGLDPRPAYPTPPAARRCCPVELRENNQVFLDGELLADLEGEARAMLDLLIGAFGMDDRKVPASKLASLAESQRLRPLSKALDRPALEPLRDRILVTKEGRNKFLEIVP